MTRNLTDHQLDAIRETEGMVGVNFGCGFLLEEGRGNPQVSLDEVVRHVDYLVKRMGIDCVGFGSDFDGTTVPEGIGDAAGLPNLLDALRSHGYDEPSLRKITHQNWVRVLRQTWGTSSR
jgi:membrane dipeptidase